MALLLLGLMVCRPTRVEALGFRIPNQDAEAIARGNAFVATADNPSALYYNPAGITQLEGYHFQYGMHSLAVNSEFVSSTTGVRARTRSEIQPVPQFYATYSPKDRPLAFGLGIYAPYGLGLEWPENSGFRTLAIEGRLLYVTVNPVVAWRVNDQLSLAFGPTINYGDLNLRQGLIAPGDEFKFQGSDMDFGYNAGLLWRPHDQWSFGVKYHSDTTIKFNGTAHTRGVVGPIPTAASRSTVSAPFAQFGAAGVSFRPTPRWNIEADVDWTDWASLDTVVFNNTPIGNVPFALNWKTSFLYELGVSYAFDNGYFVGAGYFFSGNSTSDANFNPIVPDTDLHVASLGVGYKGKRWSWAVSGQLIAGPNRQVTGSTSPSLIGESANGSYQFFNQAINFSVGRRF